MRESWRLWQINERVNAQWCLLKQWVWSCDVVSELRIQKLYIRGFLLSSCILSVFAGRCVDSSCRDVASLPPLKVCVSVWLWLCSDA
jgi:hypothetical protein